MERGSPTAWQTSSQSGSLSGHWSVRPSLAAQLRATAAAAGRAVRGDCERVPPYAFSSAVTLSQSIRADGNPGQYAGGETAWAEANNITVTENTTAE